MAETKTQVAPAAKETKAQSFVRLASARTGKALDAISVLGNLASPNYEYTPEHVTKIIGALESEVATLKAKFAKPEAATKTGFTL